MNTTGNTSILNFNRSMRLGRKHVTDVRITCGVDHKNIDNLTYYL